MTLPTAVSDASLTLDLAELEVEYAAIVDITHEVFGGEVHLEIEPDPEIVGLTYLLFCVPTTGDPATIAAGHNEWHRRVDRLISSQARGLHLGLCVEPRQ